jgi:hypothetical protein
VVNDLLELRRGLLSSAFLPVCLAAQVGRIHRAQLQWRWLSDLIGHRRLEQFNRLVGVFANEFYSGARQNLSSLK